MFESPFIGATPGGWFGQGDNNLIDTSQNVSAEISGNYPNGGWGFAGGGGSEGFRHQ